MDTASVATDRPEVDRRVGTPTAVALLVVVPPGVAQVATARVVTRLLMSTVPATRVMKYLATRLEVPATTRCSVVKRLHRTVLFKLKRLQRQKFS